MKRVHLRRFSNRKENLNFSRKLANISRQKYSQVTYGYLISVLTILRDSSNKTKQLKLKNGTQDLLAVKGISYEALGVAHKVRHSGAMGCFLSISQSFSYTRKRKIVFLFLNIAVEHRGTELG